MWTAVCGYYPGQNSALCLVTILALLLLKPTEPASTFARACRLYDQSETSTSTTLAPVEPRCECQDSTQGALVVPEAARVVFVCARQRQRFKHLMPSKCFVERFPIAKNNYIVGSPHVQHFGCYSSDIKGACYFDLGPVDKQRHNGTWMCEVVEWGDMYGSGTSAEARRVGIDLKVTDRCQPNLDNTDCKLDEFCHPWQNMCQDVCSGDGSEACSKISGASCKPNNKHGSKCVCDNGLTGIYDKRGALVRCRKPCSGDSECHSGQECRVPNFCPPAEENCERTCMNACEDSDCPANECKLDNGSCLKHATCTEHLSSQKGHSLYGCECQQGFSSDNSLQYSNLSTSCTKKCNTYLDCLEPDKETCTKGRCLDACSVNPCGLGTTCVPHGKGARRCKCSSSALHPISPIACNFPIPPKPWHPIIFVGSSQICTWPLKDQTDHLSLDVTQDCWMRRALMAEAEIPLLILVNRTFPKPTATFSYPGQQQVQVNFKPHGNFGSFIKDYYTVVNIKPAPKDHHSKLQVTISHSTTGGVRKTIQLYIELDVFGCKEDTDCSGSQVCRESRVDNKLKCMSPCSAEMLGGACPFKTTCKIQEESSRRRICINPDGSFHVFTTPTVPTTPSAASTTMSTTITTDEVYPLFNGNARPLSSNPAPKWTVGSIPKGKITSGSPLELFCHLNMEAGDTFQAESSECAWILHRNGTFAAFIAFHGNRLAKNSILPYNIKPFWGSQTKQGNKYTCKVLFSQVEGWMDGNWSCHTSTQLTELIADVQDELQHVAIKVEGDDKKPASSKNPILAMAGLVGVGIIAIMSITAMAAITRSMCLKKQKNQHSRPMPCADHGISTTVPTRPKGPRTAAVDWSKFAYRRVSSLQFIYDFGDRDANNKGRSFKVSSTSQDHVYCEVIPTMPPTSTSSFTNSRQGLIGSTAISASSPSVL